MCGSSSCQPAIQVDRAALPQSANSDALAVVLDRFWIVGSLSDFVSGDSILTLACQMGCGTLGGSCVILVKVVAADWQSDCTHCLLLVLHGCQVAVDSGDSGCESWRTVAIEINAGRQGRLQEMWRRLNQH